MLDENNPISADYRNLGLGISLDGLLVYKERGARSYSMWPIVAFLMNLPPHLRYRPENVLLLGIIAGPSKPSNFNLFLRPVIDELKEAYGKGFPMYDALSDSTFNLRCACLFWILDLPAKADVLTHKAPGSFRCCTGCDIMGDSIKKGKGSKRVFVQHHRFTKGDDYSRKDASLGNSEENPDDSVWTLTTDRVYRDNVATFLAIKVDELQKMSGDKFGEQVDKYGVSNKSVIFDLPYSDYSLIITDDVMHIAENIWKIIAGAMVEKLIKVADEVIATIDQRWGM